MSTTLERNRKLAFRANVMTAENYIHRKFLSFVEGFKPEERNDFFDPRNRDLWTREFARFLEGQIDRDRPSND